MIYLRLNFIIISFFLIPFFGTAQVGVGTPNPSEKATLEVSSQINGAGDYKGFMTARVATEAERDMITIDASDIGLQVFVTGTGCLDVFNGTDWEHIKCNSSTPSPPPRKTSIKDTIINNRRL